MREAALEIVTQSLINGNRLSRQPHPFLSAYHLIDISVKPQTD